MRLIDADDLIKERAENDPVRIAAICAQTAYDVDKVCRKISENKDMDNMIDADHAIKIVKAEQKERE